MDKGQHVAKDAIISKDEKHRYRLDRTWDCELPVLVFIMLNPSTADAKTDDPTIRRCMSFAEENGCGGIIVFNLFSLRTPYPEELWRADKPVRPKNDAEMLHGLATAKVHAVVAAWGAAKNTALNIRTKEVRKRVKSSGFDLKCLGKTASGSPRHPLYIRGGTPLQDWTGHGG